MGWFNKSSESVNNTELNELKDKVDELQSTVDFYKEEIRNSFNKRKAAFSKVKRIWFYR